MATKKLTVKQQKFVDAYDGNGVQAARQAGYKGSDNTLAVVAIENLRKPNVVKAIEEREKKPTIKRILSREERQALWTSIAQGELEDDPDTAISIKDRLKASELLGKSQADFTEKIQQDGSFHLTITRRVVKSDKAS